MRPRADEVLNTVIWTFDEHILPALKDDLPKSYGLTISNLLRHVKLRMALEGPALVADNAALRALLGRISNYIGSLKAAPARLASLHAGLAAASQADAATPAFDLPALTEEAQRLRTVIDDALKALQAQRTALGSTAAYQAIRDDIRQYLSDQLAREAPWIRDAFTLARR